MTEAELLDAVRSGDRGLAFSDVMAAIDAGWDFTPVAFSNGGVDNACGENAGSCKLLAFGAAHGLTAEQTLLLFGEHYQAVLADPDGSAHANIRAFMVSGWSGVEMHGQPLKPA